VSGLHRSAAALNLPCRLPIPQEHGNSRRLDAGAWRRVTWWAIACARRS